MISFNKQYFVAAIVLLGVEIFIAAFARDNFIRPYAGDTLAVMLLYCITRSFWNGSYYRVALGVWIVACLLEMLQYYHVVARLGLHDSTLANTLFGNTFSVMDLLAYSVGVLLILLIEKWRDKKPATTSMEISERLPQSPGGAPVEVIGK
jgi:hypothetical protein